MCCCAPVVRAYRNPGACALGCRYGSGHALAMQELRTLPSRRHASRSHVVSAPGRNDLVSRPRLVRRLLSARGTPVVLLVAPAGYGKTTLISEWARRDSRSFDWV